MKSQKELIQQIEDLTKKISLIEDKNFSLLETMTAGNLTQWEKAYEEGRFNLKDSFCGESALWTPFCWAMYRGSQELIDFCLKKDPASYLSSVDNYKNAFTYYRDKCNYRLLLKVISSPYFKDYNRLYQYQISSKLNLLYKIIYEKTIYREPKSDNLYQIFKFLLKKDKNFFLKNIEGSFELKFPSFPSDKKIKINSLSLLEFAFYVGNGLAVKVIERLVDEGHMTSDYRPEILFCMHRYYDNKADNMFNDPEISLAKVLSEKYIEVKNFKKKDFFKLSYKEKSIEFKKLA